MRCATRWIRALSNRALEAQKCVVSGETIRDKQRPLLLTRNGQLVPDIAPEEIGELDVAQDESA